MICKVVLELVKEKAMLVSLFLFNATNILIDVLKKIIITNLFYVNCYPIPYPVESIDNNIKFEQFPW